MTNLLILSLASLVEFGRLAPDERRSYLTFQSPHTHRACPMASILGRLGNPLDFDDEVSMSVLSLDAAFGDMTDWTHETMMWDGANAHWLTGATM